MYGASLSIAIVTPSLRPLVDKAERKSPPSLKEVCADIHTAHTGISIDFMPFSMQVMAGIQDKLNK